MPGERRNYSPGDTLQCQNTNRKIKISINGGEKKTQNIYCNAILSAVELVTSNRQHSKTSYTYELTLIPTGIRYSSSVTRIQASTSMHFYYALPLNENDIHSSINNAITTIAHETFHIVSALERSNRSAREEEILAYKIGICSQFIVTKQLSLSEIWRTDVGSEIKNESASISAAAGAEATKYFYNYLIGNNTLSMESDLGQRLSNDCASIIGGALQRRD